MKKSDHKGVLLHQVARMATSAAIANDNLMVTPFVSLKDTFTWCEKNKIKLKDGKKAKVGDIVACSYKGKNFKNPCELGKVVKVCKSQKLVGKNGKEHDDGPIGHIYVLTWRKQKISRKKLERNYSCIPFAISIL